MAMIAVACESTDPEATTFALSDCKGRGLDLHHERTLADRCSPGDAGEAPSSSPSTCGDTPCTDTPPAKDPDPSPVSHLPAGYMTVDQWEQRFLVFDSSKTRLEGYDIPNSYYSDGSPDGCKQAFQTANKVNTYWMFQSAHCLAAAVKMWDATRKTTYLERSLAYFENMMANAVYVNQLTRAHAVSVGCVDSVVGGNGCAGSSYSTRPDASTYKGWHGWSGAGWDGGSNGDEYPLYEGEIWANAGKLLVEMKALGLNTDATYGSRWTALLAFVKQHVWEKWYARGTGSFYRGSTYMTIPWVDLAMNLYLLSDSSDPQYTQYRDVYWNIDHIGFPAHEAFVTDPYGASLKGTQVKPFPGDSNAYIFFEQWNTTQAHENGPYVDRMMSYWVQCVRRDPACAWTLADLDKFCHTLRDHVWRDPAGTNCHTFRVDGVTCNSGFSNTYMEWSRLGGLNTTCGLEIQKRFELYDAPGSSKLNRGYSNTRAASGALSSRLLANP
jgi:hypothetical protein